MSLISVNNLTFYYDNSYDTIFEDVSFQMDTDWKLGFIGRNGRGKTTFLNLLMGKYEYRGTIHTSVNFDYFPYEIQNKGKNTIDILEEMDSQYEFWKVCRELSFLKMEEDIWDRSFDTLSNGEQAKVMFAVLFAKENNFLLIDEPTNHLDAETREIVKAYLGHKKGFLLVSHDRDFLDGCVDHILSINKADIEVVQGNFSSWWANKQRQDEYELAEHEKIKKDIKRLSAAARQANEWADQVESTKIGRKSVKQETSIGTRSYIGEKSRRMQQRRKNLEKRRNEELGEKENLLKNIEESKPVKLCPLRYHKEILIEAIDVSLYYGEKQVCDPLSFQVRNGECILLSGKNGCGKSTFLKRVLGDDIACTGSLHVPENLKISYVAQDTSFLQGSLKEFAIENKIDETLFKQFLRKMDVQRTQFEKNMEDFSEGQKKKVLLAKSLSEQAHLYLWDEPLNFIDVFSRIQIEELIKEYRPAIIMVEHDQVFAKEVADKMISM